MLKIFFGEKNNVLHNVSQYFDNRFHYDWLEDEFVIQMILDVDQSIVESPMCIKSPVLRQICLLFQQFLQPILPAHPWKVP